jgi:16S rRNA (uracil1498-N3)-methyltransferase
MNRFFISSPEISENLIIVNDSKQAHHIRSVLRLKLKEPVVIFDKDGNEYDCLVKELMQDVVLEIMKRDAAKKLSSKMKLTIACAIPKKAKFDDIVDKLTQLQVDKIIPLVTERVVVRLDSKKEELRIRRWRKIAQSAAEQSQRRDIPEVSAIMTFKEMLALSSAFDLKLIPTLAGRKGSIKETLNQYLSSPSNLLILIGPEGDFSDEEIKSAKEAGFIPVSLGKSVLRVDTAAIAAASFFILYAND